MTNWKMIEEAVKLVEDYFAFEGIVEAHNTIFDRAVEWYNKTEITDSEMLAAAVISGRYTLRVTWEELKQMKEFYFPSCPIELTEFHIGEIEAAVMDMLWR